MSSTSVYAIYKTKATMICSLRNSYGSGPAMWDYISMKCLGEKFNMFDEKDFWSLWQDERLTENEVAVLLSTYDKGFIEVGRLEDFAKACEELHDKIIATTTWEWSHFADIGKAAKSLATNHDYRCIGLGIGCTSVSDPWEEFDYGRDPWSIYSEILELKKERIKSPAESG